MPKENLPPSFAGARRCVACRKDQLEFREHVSTERIAHMWTLDRRGRSSDNTDEKFWLEGVTQAFGADGVRFDRCIACGLEMATPAKCWPEGSYPEDEDYPVRWEFDQALDDLGQRSLNILELGCGTGVFLERAQARGHRVIGIDFSEKAVAEAKRKGLTALHGGFGQLEQHLESTGQKRAFDAVAIFQVLEHLPDPGSVIDALAPFVRSGSKLVVACPGPDRFTRLIKEQQTGLRDLWDYPPHHVLRWTIPAFEAFFESHGWIKKVTREEPLTWIGPAAQVGCTRAMWRGKINNDVLRRLAIARAYAELALARLRSHLTGLSIYAIAERA